MKELTFPPIYMTNNGEWRRVALPKVPQDTRTIMLSSGGHQFTTDIGGDYLNKHVVYIDICCPKRSRPHVSVMAFHGASGVQMFNLNTLPLQGYKLFRLAQILLSIK